MLKLWAAVGLLATTFFVAPANADIILDTNGLGGTGDNVIFNQISGGLVTGHLNGQHNEIVRFLDRSSFNLDGGILSGLFSGAANGNDIKIVNTSELDVKVYDPTNTSIVTTTREIFSLKGTGTVKITVTALEADGSFKEVTFGGLLGGAEFGLDQSAQQGFDLTAINGERIYDLDLRVIGGSIPDFDHYRIEVGPTVNAVPGPVAGAGIPGLVAGAFFLIGLA